MELPDAITKLPLSAQLVFVGVVAIAYVLVHLGIVNGRKSPRHAPEMVKVSMDHAAIDRLTGEASGIAIAITSATETTRDVVRAIDALGVEVRECAREVRELSREINAHD